LVTITETNDGGVEVIDLTTSGGGGISSPLTTKGDLFTYSTTDARLGVGTDGQALIADSAEATGLRWGTVSADNFATADLTLTGNRTHDLDGNDLTFQINATQSLDINGITGLLSHYGSINTYGSNSKITARNAANTWDIATLKSFGTGNAGALTLSFNGNDYLNVNITNGIEMSRYLNPTVKTFRINPLNASYLTIQDVQNSNYWYFQNDGGFGVGILPTARLHVKGGGGTSSTVIALFTNSASSKALEIKDDISIGFFGATTVTQPASTGETTGFTAGSGTGINDDSTFTGNVGATAYRISDIVKHLKNLGLIAQ